MLKQAQFLENKKVEEKNISASWKQRLNQTKIYVPPNKTLFQQHCTQNTKAKPFLRLIEKEEKNLKNLEKIDVSSSESTYLSEKEKTRNLLVLKKEINDWRRQETLRTRVNKVLEKAGSSIDINGEPTTMLTDTLKSHLVENVQKYKRVTPNTTDTNQDKESEKIVRIKIKKPKKENTHLVTWLSMQPKISSRTWLKSVSDYLFETEQSPTTKRRLSLSPETLRALNNAEKLVEDADRQLAEINVNSFVIDDLEINKDAFKSNETENIYARNIVTSTFHKGFYDPRLSKILKKEQFKSKLRLTEILELKEPANVYKCSRIARESEISADVSVRSKLDEINVKSKRGDCPVCKSSKIETIKNTHENDKSTEFSYAVKNVMNKNIGEEQLKKLNIQKGPIISIKGDFAMQTMKENNIKPNQIFKGSLENIAMYEFRHKPCTDEYVFRNKTASQVSETPETMTEYEISILNKNSSETNIKQSAFKHTRHDRRHIDKLIPKKKNLLIHSKSLIVEDYITKKREINIDIGNDVSTLNQKIDVDLRKLNLKESEILAHVDLLLNQQRIIIQQVHNVTENFDKFLACTIPLKISSTSNKKNNLQACDNTKGNSKESNVICENKNGNSTNELTLSECSNRNGFIFNANVDFDINCDIYSSLSYKSNKFEKFKNNVKETPINFENKLHNKSDTFDLKAIQKSCRVTKHSYEQSVMMKEEPFIQTLKDAESMETFESTDSTDIVASISNTTNLQISKLNIRENNFVKEYSSNGQSFVQSSIPKSNSDFIKNLKGTLILKDDNLDANIYKTNVKRIGEIVKLRENTKTNSNLKVNVICVENEEQKDIFITNSKTPYPSKEIAKHQKERSEKTESVKSVKRCVKRDNEIKYRTHVNFDILQDNSEKNSKKTSHLISNVTYHNINENIPDSENFLRLFSIFNGNIDSNVKRTVFQESNNENSTEFKMKSKLTEASGNFNGLMKSTSNNIENCNNTNIESNIQLNDVTLDNNIPEIGKCNFLNTRSFVTELEDNSNVVQNTVQQHKQNLLKKLESCCISSPNRSKKLFTSTILDDNEPPNYFSKLKISSETSLEMHSEGEIFSSSSSSYSLGEIRRKMEMN